MTEPGDVVVINTISIKNDAPAPIVRTNEIRGGILLTADLTARNAVPDYVRQEGQLCYVVSNDSWYQLKGGILNTNWVLTSLGGGGGSGTDQIQDVFTPTSGQTNFTLSQTPLDTNDVHVFVNTVKYTNGIDYTVSGTSLLWTGPFSLDTQDALEVTYYVS